MKKTNTLRALLLPALAMAAIANAEIVDINWTGDAFSHKASIASKKFLEVCGKLKMGDGVAWQFKGSVPGDFNIHYHVGNDVTYPENRKNIASAEGTLSAPLDQDFCWMWTNHTTQPLDIAIQLKRVKSSN